MMLQRAYAANIILNRPRLLERKETLKTNSTPSYNKNFDYLTEWYCPLETDNRNARPKKWVFKII